MEINNIKMARWSTDNDKAIRNARIEKSSSGTDFSFLQKNLKEIVDLHDGYYTEKMEAHHQKTIEKIEERKKQIEEYNQLKESLKHSPVPKCNCGGNLHYVEYFGFIGCDNYTAQGFKHFTLGKPLPFDAEDYYEKMMGYFEVSKNYLSDIVKMLPVKVKASDLYEFLTLRNVKLLRDDLDSKYFKNGKQSKELSDKRETMIGYELESRFNRVGKQILITYQLESETFVRFAIPDFLVFDGEKLLIFEQKKNASLIKKTQIELYKALLKKIMPNNDVDVYIVLEEYSEFNYESEYKTISIEKIQSL